MFYDSVFFMVAKTAVLVREEKVANNEEGEDVEIPEEESFEVEQTLSFYY